MIKAILFDMDGVLLDSYKMWFSMFEHALKKFMNQPLTDKEFKEHIWSRSFQILVKEYFPGKEKEVEAYYFPKVKDYMDQMEVYPVEDVLKQLKEKGLKTAIVSNTFTSTVNQMLTKAGFDKYFDLVLGGDCVKHAKPSPDSLLFCLDKLNLKPQEAIYIGDSKYDIQAGKAAKVFTVGLKIDGGNKTIKDLKELLTLV
jgi:pyrophosphatase PpaX